MQTRKDRACLNGDVAHQVEQRIENPCVAGSSPAVPTKQWKVIWAGPSTVLKTDGV